MKIKLCLFILTFLNAIFQPILSIKLKTHKKRKEASGDNIGLNLYHTQVVTQPMKRPQKWFFNVMLQKPNERFYKEAEYNGLRYQTELLQNNLEREYDSAVRDYWDEKLNVYEAKMLNAAKMKYDRDYNNIIK
jgi:hypothetical protein